MSTGNFFANKNKWSEIKDELLGAYLKLYFSKVLMTKQPLCYIDCFAGKGLFDDGAVGSPIIALNQSEEAIKNSSNKSANISCHFIEGKYGNELSYNIGDRNAIIYSGKYEVEIEDIFKKCIGKNVFLYVDPYGIKSLHFDKFNLVNKYHFNSIELFLNLNSFGFFREGCRVLDCNNLPEVSDELEERESAEVTKLVNDSTNMDRVANGDYWQQIVRDYNDGLIDANKAEERFVKEYCAKLGEIFEYVIDIPIKVKIINLPKYRMIFCTNHNHGFIEMSNNMNKRWREMQEDEHSRQSALFEFDVESNGETIQYFNGEIKQQDVKNLIKKLMPVNYIKYDEFLCKFIKQHGILYNSSKVSEHMKQMETDGMVEISRYPPLTPTGRPTTWMDYKKNIKMRLKS